jgi:hypothetical protein
MPFSQLPHLRAAEGYVRRRTTTANSEQSESARRVGIIVHSGDVLLIYVQVHVVATRYYREKIRLIQTSFNSRTGCGVQGYRQVSAINSSELVESI